MIQTKPNTVFSSETERETFAITLAYLIRKGYDRQFRREPTCIFCLELNRWFSADEFVVDEKYESGISSGPEAQRIIYAVTTNTNVKGILVDSYGAYADNISPDMFQKLTDKREEIVSKDKVRIQDVDH